MRPGPVIALLYCVAVAGSISGSAQPSNTLQPTSPDGTAVFKDAEFVVHANELDFWLDNGNVARIGLFQTLLQ
jgi:hypothetical protein